MNSKSTSPLFRTKNGRISVAMFVSPDESSLDAVLDAQKRGKIGSAFIEIVISSNDNAKSLTIAASEEIATAVVSHNYSEDSDAVQNLLELLDEHEIGMIVIDKDVYKRQFPNCPIKRMKNTRTAPTVSLCCLMKLMQATVYVRCR